MPHHITLLIFTDLDGTLLDHQSYSFAPAIGALDRIKKLRIPLILCSSKTRAEILGIRKDLANTHPYVVENGGSVVVPAGSFKGFERHDHVENFGLSYDEILGHIHFLRRRDKHPFRGFYDFSEQELAKISGLSLNQAKEAKQRDSSEPILWQGTKQSLAEFELQLDRLNLRIVRGGRFYHIMGRTDKAAGVNWLTDLYRKHNPDMEIKTVGLGDSPNDEAMLRTVDIAVVVKPLKGGVLQLDDIQSVIYSLNSGPQGWRQVIHQILDQYS